MDSVSTPEDQFHGSSAASRKTMYGTPGASEAREKTLVKTNQYTPAIRRGSSTVHT